MNSCCANQGERAAPARDTARIDPGGRFLGILRATWRAIAIVSVLFLVSVLTLRFTPVGRIAAAQMMKATPLSNLADADAVVILGGDPLRAADALRVYRAGKAPVIIVSGDPNESLPILAAGQVPQHVIRLDPVPSRTMDHPRTIRSISGIDTSSRLILVSSMLHQQRALSIFREAGYEHVTVCSLEWERFRASEEHGLHHALVACLLYEWAARVKSWIVD